MIELAIFAIGFAGAFIGSLAGGYGLFVVPLLLLLGIPPHIALGMLNLGGVGNKLSQWIKFSQFNNIGVPRREMVILALIAVPATFIGAMFVVKVSPDHLEKLTGIVLLVILPLLFLNKDLGIKEKRAIGKKRGFAHILFFASRMWTGFFSPGSGVIEAYIKMRFYGYTILQGKAVTRVAHIIADTIAATVFIAAGFYNLKYTIIIFLGMFLGGYIGTGYALKKGDAWLKPLVGVVILITGVKMLFF